MGSRINQHRINPHAAQLHTGCYPFSARGVANNTKQRRFSRAAIQKAVWEFWPYVTISQVLYRGWRNNSYPEYWENVRLFPPNILWLCGLEHPVFRMGVI